MRVHSGDTVLGERVKTTLETSYRAYKNGPLEHPESQLSLRGLLCLVHLDLL